MAEGVRGFHGIYRAQVAVADDPEQRRRYRVRVSGVHPNELPDAMLPWAESCLFGGKSFGDFPVFEVGDRVFVLFEGADRRYPILMGGWLSSYAGISDLPAELDRDRRERWLRLDRAGNALELSPLADEMHVQLRSGNARVTVRQLDDSVVIEASRRVLLEASRVGVVAADLVENVDRRQTSATERETILTGDLFTVQSERRIDLGRYEDPINGALLPHTTPEVVVDADDLIQWETRTRLFGHSESEIDFDSDDTARMHAVTRVTIEADGTVHVEADRVEVVGTTLVDVQAPTVNVDGANVVAVHGGAVNVQADGALSVTAGGALSLEAGGALSLSAASIALTASGGVAVTAGGTLAATATGALTLHSDASLTAWGGFRMTLDAIGIVIG